MFHTPEQYRIKIGPAGSDQSYGCNGCFYITLNARQNIFAFVIASVGMGWEQVSVTIRENGNIRTPIWIEMCQVKDLFWDQQDCVVQYHHANSQYVNNHPNCLHLWRPINQDMPIPPSILVGLKSN